LSPLKGQSLAVSRKHVPVAILKVVEVSFGKKHCPFVETSLVIVGTHSFS